MGSLETQSDGLQRKSILEILWTHGRSVESVYLLCSFSDTHGVSDGRRFTLRLQDCLIDFFILQFHKDDFLIFVTRFESNLFKCEF